MTVYHPTFSAFKKRMINWDSYSRDHRSFNGLNFTEIDRV